MPGDQSYGAHNEIDVPYKFSFQPGQTLEKPISYSSADAVKASHENRSP